MTRCPECNQVTCGATCPGWALAPTLAHADAVDVPEGPTGTVRTRAPRRPLCACGARMYMLEKRLGEFGGASPTPYTTVHIIAWGCANAGCRRVITTWEPA